MSCEAGYYYSLTKQPCPLVFGFVASGRSWQGTARLEQLDYFSSPSPALCKPTLALTAAAFSLGHSSCRGPLLRAPTYLPAPPLPPAPGDTCRNWGQPPVVGHGMIGSLNRTIPLSMVPRANFWRGCHHFPVVTLDVDASGRAK